MTQNETLSLLLSTLSGMMAAQGYPVDVQAAFQPTKQGTQAAPYIALHTVTARRYGHPQITEQYNPATYHFDRVETYWLEETYQITAFCISDPQNIAAPTAYTYATRAAAILQSAQARRILSANGVGFQRITEIRTPYFTDDRERNEMAPSFDLVLTRQESLTYSVPVIADAEIDINRV